MAYTSIKRGDTGVPVSRIQGHLKRLGYYNGEQNETFDEATENAVKAFQKDNNIEQTGVVGYKTLSLISAKSKEAADVILKKAETKQKDTKPVTVETGRWHDHKFIVSAQEIRSFTDISIKGGSETESKDKNTTGFVSRKGGSPTELSLTVPLNAHAGNNVRSEAMKWVDEARNGACDYFYVGDKKLIEGKLMLISASVSKVEISHNGTWMSAQVALTFKQSDGSAAASSGGSGGSGGGGGGGYSGGGGGGSYYSGGSGGGSQKVSVNTTPPTTTVGGIPKYEMGNPLVKNYADPNKFTISMPSTGTGFLGQTPYSGGQTTKQAVATGVKDASYYYNYGRQSTPQNTTKTVPHGRMIEGA